MHAILKRSRPGPAPASLFHRPQPVVFLRQKVGNPGDYRTHTNAELRTRNSEPQAKVNSNSRTVACGFRTADARREATPEPAAAEPPLLHFRARRSLPAFGGGASGYPHTPPATPREATPKPAAAAPPHCCKGDPPPVPVFGLRPDPDRQGIPLTNYQRSFAAASAVTAAGGWRCRIGRAGRSAMLATRILGNNI
jgi:hypothetical protein